MSKSHKDNRFGNGPYWGFVGLRIPKASSITPRTSRELYKKTTRENLKRKRYSLSSLDNGGNIVSQGRIFHMV